MLLKRNPTHYLLCLFFKKTSVKPDEINPVLKQKNSSEVSQSLKLYKVFSRPNITLDDMTRLESVKGLFQKTLFSPDVLEQTEVQVKYSGYIEKEKANAKKLNNLENIKIPS